MKKVLVIVFGDIERSPRTLNHAYFLHEAGFNVHLVGFAKKDSALLSKFTLNRLISHEDWNFFFKILCYFINLIVLIYYLILIRPSFIFLQVFYNLNVLESSHISHSTNNFNEEAYGGETDDSYRLA